MAILNVPEGLYKRLVERAQALRTSLDVLAAQAIERYLWQTEFDELLTKVHSRVHNIPDQEIEADITAASEEVHQLRRGNHRPA